MYVNLSNFCVNIMQVNLFNFCVNIMHVRVLVHAEALISVIIYVVIIDAMITDVVFDDGQHEMTLMINLF